MKRVFFYDKATRTFNEKRTSHTENKTPFRIVSMVHKLDSDGSVLDKPMSQTYINHIRSRNSETIPHMKSSMGKYGA